MTLSYSVSDVSLNTYKILGKLRWDNNIQCNFTLDLSHNFQRFNLDLDLPSILSNMCETFYMFCISCYRYPMPFEAHMSHNFYYSLNQLYYRVPEVEPRPKRKPGRPRKIPQKE